MFGLNVISLKNMTRDDKWVSNRLLDNFKLKVQSQNLVKKYADKLFAVLGVIQKMCVKLGGVEEVVI
jgi:hypothetical protein